MDIRKTLQAMTLEQKCALLSGKDVFKTRGYKALDIPQMFLSDGPNGLRKQAGASDHLGLNPSLPATCFPTASTIACSWNEELGEELGRVLGTEAAAQDVGVVLGPGLNMKRSPLCGRNFEYFSEDPILAGKLAAAYVRGIQEKGVSACPKHYAVNNQETRRMASDSILDERTMREIYLTGFEIAVKEGKPETMMTSYNLINGTYANEHEQLLDTILRKEWGYEGMVVTDWGGSNDHALGVKAGSTLEMPAPGGDSVRELLKAVEDGKIKETDVDARCQELLRLVFKTDEALKKAPKKFDAEAHHQAARAAAAQSLTLLRNEGNLLPLAIGTEVAVIGDFARTPRYQGAGSSMVNSTRADALWDCLDGSGLNVIGFAQGFERFGKPDEVLLKEAVNLAQQADVALLCLGLDEVQESEGLDRRHMKLAQNQIDLLRAVSKVNPRTAVVLFSGCAVETPFRKDCMALLYAGLGGQAGAGAVVDALVGRVNPSGKLAETWPEALGDTPARGNFAGERPRVEYREGIYIGYRYYQKAGVPVAFPFGFGLSYTDYQYSDLKASEREVSFSVKNTGSMKGTEIAQLYVSKPGSPIFRPVRELKGFARAELEAGEEKRLSIALDDYTFRYFNVRTNRWETEEGTYILAVGKSSEDIVLSAEVSIRGTGAPDPYEGKDLSWYHSGHVQNVSDAQFEALLGRKIPSGKRSINRQMTLGEMKYSRSPIAILAGFLITMLMKRSLKKGKPNLNLLFIYNMPLRALAKMTGGMISIGMVDGIVMELRGFWIIGILRVLYEFIKNQALNARLEKRLGEQPS